MNSKTPHNALDSQFTVNFRLALKIL